jgi:hypothetical protein
MSSTLLILWAITGGAIATWVMMHIWLPDPPPPPEMIGRYVGILIAGIIGGVVGGYLGNMVRAGSDPMPGIVGAIGGALIVSGAALFLGGAGRGVAR